MLPGVTPGTNFERFRAKAEAYLHEHLDNLAMQRLRRNKQLTSDDLTEFEQGLVASGGQQVDIAWATEQGAGLGIFVRNLVGLDRSAAIKAFEHYLDGTKFSADQVRFVNLVVDELTKNGVMEPARSSSRHTATTPPPAPTTSFPTSTSGSSSTPSTTSSRLPSQKKSHDWSPSTCRTGTAKVVNYGRRHVRQSAAVV